MISLPPIASSYRVAVLALLLVGCTSQPPVEARHATAHAGSDFRATSHRRFDDVAHWTKVFDDPKRQEWQRPAELVAALRLPTGSCVADLGAGTGYLLSHLSRAVGPQGCVVAVEVEPVLVDHLKARIESESLDNVRALLAPNDSSGLADASVATIVILDTFHHLDRRLAYLKGLRSALSDHGRVAVIDWRKEPLPEGPPLDHKIAQEQVVDEMVKAGFRLIETLEVLPYQYVLLFEK